MADAPDPHAVTTTDELEALIGVPHDLVKGKIHGTVSDTARSFIGRSPFLMVSSSDASGRLDASPKGDPPGFVRVIDESTVAIPERKGNSLGYGPRNILETGRIGLIFLVPGQRESLRINGRARLSRDPALLATLAVQDIPALMATIVDVEECFFHCGKALIRSKLWTAASDEEVERKPIAEEVGELFQDDSITESIAESLEENYRTELY